MRRLLLGETLNVRDLGGYPTSAGGYTPYGRFLRSAVPTGLTDAHVALLHTLSITTIIDLRSAPELAQQPSFFAGRPDFAYHHLPLLGGGRTPTEESQVAPFYLAMAADFDTIRPVFQTIAAAPAGVLYHCTAGKDRTGILSAILLSLAGVDPLDIVADYQVSATYIRAFVQRLQSAYPNLAAWVGQSDPAYMDGFLDGFARAYQTPEAYLLQAGLTPGEIQRVRARLLPA